MSILTRWDPFRGLRPEMRQMRRFQRAKDRLFGRRGIDLPEWPAPSPDDLSATYRQHATLARWLCDAAPPDVTDELAAAYAKVAKALRPWTIDFHVAQNDGTVKGSGSHDKTGRHCQPTDPNGKLDIVRDAGAWLRDEKGEPVRRLQHMCWDGCMFPNSVMLDQNTWNDVLRVMMAVRDAHGGEEA